MTDTIGQHAAPGTEERNQWQHERAMLIAGLREVADWLEEHPEVPNPVTARLGFSFNGHRDAALEQMRAITKALPRARKGRSGDYYFVSAHFGGVEIDAHTTAVCERVEVGVETVVDYDIPDEVKERYRVTREQPVFEVRCPESLLSPREQATAEIRDVLDIEGVA